MQTLYRYDERRVFTGEVEYVADSAGAPVGWTRTAPPALQEGQYAVFSGRDGWQVVGAQPPLPRAELDRLFADLEQARKDAEAQGVTINGIRYAGDPDNRQALNESLQFAAASSMTTFAGWKDSDDVFHADHPVADVQAAYEQIGYRRGALIALEGQYAAQLQAGEIDSIEGLSWDV